VLTCAHAKSESREWQHETFFEFTATVNLKPLAILIEKLESILKNVIQEPDELNKLVNDPDQRAKKFEITVHLQHFMPQLLPARLCTLHHGMEFGYYSTFDCEM
jgi:hypothetical protein